MKKLVVAMALLLSVAGFSQTKEKSDRKKDKERTEKSRDEGKENRYLEDFNDLDLSEKQQTQLKALYENERKNRSKDRADFKRGDDADRPSDSERREMQGKMKERREALDGKVKNILNDKQYAKWKDKQDTKMREHLSRG